MAKKARRALQDYDTWIQAHPTVAADLEAHIIDVLDDAGLTFDRVSVRIKDRTSFARKLANEAYPDYDSFTDAHDVIGVRVITFHSSEIPQLKDALSGLFTVVRVIDKAAETAREGRFGYASQHLIVSAKDEPWAAEDGASPKYIEIQLRTVLQHAWAEFEHDVRYKNQQHPETSSPEVQRAFTLAAGLIELADEQFDKIAGIIGTSGEEVEGTLDEESLPRVLSRIVGSKYPTSRVDYYHYAIEMLAAHDITTVAQLRELLVPKRLKALRKAMNYPYNPGQVRLVDDMLLFAYGREHIRKTVHIGDNAQSRPGRLGNRWQQLGQKTG
ncbi:GTP pyrophosphokinase [Corynebacterium evansiae]